MGAWRVLGWCSAAWLAAQVGCTLAFDPSSVAFEQETTQREDAGQERDEREEPDDLPSDASPDEDDGPDAPEPIEGLGEVCGWERLSCKPGGDSWPACAHARCQQRMDRDDALCLMNAGTGYGYCSVPCSGAEECVGEPRDDFKKTFGCFPDPDGASFCKPGSQLSCLSDGDCEAGESCKEVADHTGTQVRRRCQTDTPNGARVGEFCNEDPDRADNVRRCANDRCADDLCLGLCDPQAQGADESCGRASLRCAAQDDQEGKPSGVCAPRGCEEPSVCGEQGAYCTTDDEGLSPEGGVCRVDNPDAEGSEPLGEACFAGLDFSSVQCASRMCIGNDPYFYCSALCNLDSDCEEEQLCALTRLLDTRSGASRFYNLCQYAKGTKTRCDESLAHCEGSEVCAPFLFGEVEEGGGLVSGVRAEGRCVEPIPGGVAQGASCGDQTCSAPDACVGDPGVCSEVCGTFLDCTDFRDCREVVVMSGEDTVEGQTVYLGFCL